MNYGKFVHEYTDRNGKTLFAVAEWVESAGQYQCPLSKRTAKLTGCHIEFSRTLSGLGSFPTRRQALRNARYLFGEEKKR